MSIFIISASVVKDVTLIYRKADFSRAIRNIIVRPDTNQILVPNVINVDSM